MFDPFDTSLVEDAKKYVNEYIKKEMNWREGFMHRRIYNEINYRLGILKKVELARQSITCASHKEIIKLLYILGYSEKQITYMCYEYGYRNFTIDQIRTHIKKQKTQWNKEKEEFMNEIVEAKNSIFQTMRQSIMDTERTTINIYLDKIKILQDALANLCPINDSSKFKATVNHIEKLQGLVKEAHGIDKLREASIDVEAKIAIARGSKEDDKKDEPLPQGNLI